MRAVNFQQNFHTQGGSVEISLVLLWSTCAAVCQESEANLTKIKKETLLKKKKKDKQGPIKLITILQVS